MGEGKPYIIVRVGADGQGQVVHSTDTLKDARYWLTYIAEAGDALFTTPAHPKYDGNGAPKYNAHLLSRGKVEYSEEKWRSQLAQGGATLTLPQ